MNGLEMLSEMVGLGVRSAEWEAVSCETCRGTERR